MGVFKTIGYGLGGVVLGVAAVAAAPFTGGGSLLGAATLAGSLAGAGAVAAGTAAVAGGAGVLLARNEEEENAKKDEKIAEYKKIADKYEDGIKEAISKFQGDKEYFNYIIGVTALGISIANADGEISEEEIREIEEFVGGIASSNYPLHVKETIQNLYNSKPNFNTAMTYLEKINPSNYENIKNLLELVAIADGYRDEKEDAFIKAFESQIVLVEYKPEIEDIQNNFLLEIKSKLWG